MAASTLLRGVSALRLSVLTDETTSPERQREANARIAGELGIDLGDREAVDLGVSASKTTPFERPELGAWLGRPAEYDALVFWRFDRAIRSMTDMHELAKWAREHRKMLVFAEGVGGGMLKFDFRNPMDPTAELMMLMLAFAAQVEATSIKERVLGAQAAMRAMPLRWRGSRPQYGYQPAPLDGGGWTLIPDPDAVKVIERIIRDLIEGKTASTVAAELNAEEVPTPRDFWALKNQRTTGGRTGGWTGDGGDKAPQRERFSWTPSVIKRLLTSPALLGWKMHQGKPVRDAEGRPVMATNAPVLTRERFDQIGALFDARAINNGERKDTNALLLGVVHCVSCDGRMYLNKQDNKQAPTYKCNSHARGDNCEAPANVRGDWVDEYVEREFLSLVGDLEVREVRVIPGYDPAPEIAATLAEFEEHQRQEGRQRSKAAREAWQRRADALDTRLAELEATPKREECREVVGTGRTFADVWKAADTAGKRALLLEADAHLTVKRGTRGGWRTLDERRVVFEIRHDLFAVAADEIQAAYAEAA